MEKKACRFGHECTSRCGNDIECPCQSEHCCALTESCDGEGYCDDHYVEEEFKKVSDCCSARIYEPTKDWAKCLNCMRYCNLENADDPYYGMVVRPQLHLLTNN